MVCNYIILTVWTLDNYGYIVNVCYKTEIFN